MKKALLIMTVAAATATVGVFTSCNDSNTVACWEFKSEGAIGRYWGTKAEIEAEFIDIAYIKKVSNSESDCRYDFD